MNNEISKGSLWTGRIMSGFAFLFLAFDGIMKFVKPPVVVQTTVVELGYPESSITLMGFTALIPLGLYIIPRTSILGAILLTGHLGGAIASHVRVGNPLFSHTLFPVYIGILIWLGLWLRDKELRKLIPTKIGIV